MNYEVNKLSKDQIDLSKWEFEAQQRGEQPVLLCDFFSRSLNTYFVKYITGENKNFSYLFTDSNKLNRLVEESDLYFGEFRKRVGDKIFLKHVIKSAVDIPREFNRQADIDIAKLREEKGLTGSRLAQFWKKLDEEFLKVIPWFWYPWFLAKEDVLPNRVRSGLEKYRKQIEEFSDFEEALLSTIFPIKKTNFQLEQSEMYELALIAEKDLNFLNNPEFQVKAGEYLRRYDWLTTFILTPVLPMNYEQLIERVERSVKEKYPDFFLKQKAESTKKEALAEKVIGLVSGDAGLMDDISDARELAYALTAGIEEAYMSTSKYLTLLQLAAKEMGVAFEETKYFLSKEIFQALDKLESIDVKKIIKDRRNGFVMMMLGGRQYALYGHEGHELSQWIDRELNKIDESIREFKGQIACKGVAKGKVRIALEPAQAHELEVGEILVCPMTNPDYVPAMKRSVAIITDEGGLLSHAAIMSREFNKPCVIGTKIATKLLKNGMMVEVDANSGIIKIINE